MVQKLCDLMKAESNEGNQQGEDERQQLPPEGDHDEYDQRQGYQGWQVVWGHRVSSIRAAAGPRGGRDLRTARSALSWPGGQPLGAS
jgi:hypothetical protein